MRVRVRVKVRIRVRIRVRVRVRVRVSNLRGAGGGVVARGARAALGGHPLAVEPTALARGALHGTLSGELAGRARLTLAAHESVGGAGRAGRARGRRADAAGRAATVDLVRVRVGVRVKVRVRVRVGVRVRARVRARASVRVRVRVKVRVRVRRSGPRRSWAVDPWDTRPRAATARLWPRRRAVR